MKRAFTLIELIIIISIIGVVAMAGLANVTRITKDATDKTAVARVKQLNIAKDQFIQESGRLEAISVWGSPPNNIIAGQTDSTDERRYNLLKRYIERPQASLAEFAPIGYIIISPSNPSTDRYSVQDPAGATLTETY